MEIKNPTNDTTYNISSVYLNFVVTPSKLWNPISPIFLRLNDAPSITVTLDKKLVNSTSMPFDYSWHNVEFELNQMSPKLHTLNVTAMYCTYYKGPRYSESDIALSPIENGVFAVYKHPVVVSDMVYFTTVEEPLVQISSSSAQTPTPIASVKSTGSTVKPSFSIPEFPSWILLPLAVGVLALVMTLRSG